MVLTFFACANIRARSLTQHHSRPTSTACSKRGATATFGRSGRDRSQQQLTSLHRVRSTWMAARTMRMNSARGLLREFGIVFPAGASTLPDRVQLLIEDADAAVPMVLRDLLQELVLEIGELESRIKTVEKHLQALASQTPVVERLR